MTYNAAVLEGSTQVLMRTRVSCPLALLPGVLRNEQASGCAVNKIDQGNFKVMKTLVGWEAARCDDHQFWAKLR